MNKNMKQRKGFTTVELVIVIAVIAVLAVVLVPTFSGLIEKANLSSDKQNVRNMNVCLATYILEDDPMAFGTVQQRLEGFGYKRGDCFTPKTAGHKFLWWAEKNVILLVKDNEVIFPEEYADAPVDNVRMCFDMSLPGAEVIRTNNPGVTVNGKQLAVKYTFKADDEERPDYSNWLADFYISFDRDLVYSDDVVLAGAYGKYDWIAMNSKDLLGGAGNKLPANAKYKLPITGAGIKYEYLQAEVKKFDCGVINMPDDIMLTVELRLTNNNNPDEYVILGVFTYPQK